MRRNISPGAKWAMGLILSGCVCSLQAQEGNYKFEAFGNQSVLLNGNVTGSVGRW